MLITLSAAAFATSIAIPKVQKQRPRGLQYPPHFREYRYHFGNVFF
jgi:hypothetical protein